MSNPQPPSRLTPQQALAAARAAAAARTPAQTVTAVNRKVSEGVITAREKAALWAKAAIRPWLAQIDPYDGRAAQQFTEAAANRMAIAQRTTAVTAAAGQKQILTMMGISVTPRPSSPLDIRAPGAVFDGGRVSLEHGNVSVTYAGDESAELSAKDLTTVEVLNRPIRAIRYLESQGATRDEALQAATERLDVIVDDNLMLAQRFAESEVINLAADQPRSRIVGMRRVIHPELSRTGVCGLCIAAADRLYTVRELLPIHKRCKCTTAAVTEDYDPADELNAIDLSQLYTDAGGTSRAHLKRTRYKTGQHGELGAVLVPQRDYKPRGTDADVETKAPVYVGGPESKPEIARRHLPILEENLAKLRSDGLSEESSQVRYHKEQIAKFRADLAAEKAAAQALPKPAAQPRKGMATKQKDPNPAAASGGGGGRGGGGGNDGTGFGPEDDHPDLGPDEHAAARRAAETAVQTAREAEPAISDAVRATVDAGGGELHRFDSRIKTAGSLYRKIQDDMVARGEPADVVASQIRDTVRYTAVLPDDGYWARGTAIGDKLAAAGFERVKRVRGWLREGYRGRNDTFRSPDGVDFEVQFHTEASLAAAERTHALYEVIRLPTTPEARREALRAEQNAVFAAVPVPDDVPWVE
nr:hypothetical protein [Mycobacterium sp. UM_NZ2]